MLFHIAFLHLFATTSGLQSDSEKLSVGTLLKLMEPLNMTNPVIVIDQDQTHLAMSLFKTLSKAAQTVLKLSPSNAMELKHELLLHPVLWISNDSSTLIQILNRSPENTLDLRVASKRPFLILPNNGTDTVSQAKLTIDQQVYFVDRQSWSIQESYVINGHRVQRTLGQYNDMGQLIPDPETTGNPFDIVIQRSNFHGLRLNAFAEDQSPYIYFIDNFDVIAKKSTIIPNTYEVQSFSLHSNSRKICGLFR